MPKLKPEEIDHLASLARLPLTEEENKQFAKQLPEIIHFVGQLQGAKVADALDGNAISQDQLREDVEESDSLSLEQLEKLAPKWQEGQVVIPAVFGENADD